MSVYLYVYNDFISFDLNTQHIQLVSINLDVLFIN